MNFSRISRVHISKSKRCFNVKSSIYYLHMKTKILADFQICIIVPLTKDVNDALVNLKMNYYLAPDSALHSAPYSALYSKI